MIRSTPRLVRNAAAAVSSSMGYRQGNTTASVVTVTTVSRRCFSRAASGNNLVGLIDSSQNHCYYDAHRPKTTIQKTMQPSSSSGNGSSSTRSYGTTLQLTSLDEPSTGRVTWDSPVRHHNEDVGSTASTSITTTTSVTATMTSSSYDYDTDTTIMPSTENAWSHLHGYIPSECPATTEDGGDMMLDVPSAAAEVAMMLDTSYYHASYRGSNATNQKE